MNSTKIFLLAVFTSLVLLASAPFTAEASSLKNNIVLTDHDDYRYERVYQDGRWYVYVYDENDLLVHIYEEDDD